LEISVVQVGKQKELAQERRRERTQGKGEHLGRGVLVRPREEGAFKREELVNRSECCSKIQSYFLSKGKV
jgi:hypothetical protein